MPSVEDAVAGQRLDVVVAQLLGISRSRAAGRIDAGLVNVDGTLGRRNQRVRAGQRLDIGAEPNATVGRPPELPPVRYEDDELLVLAKPAGLVVHPGAGRPDATLVDALRAAGIELAAAGGSERPGIVHRLDRDTSGLLVVAKTDRAHEGLVRALAHREVERRYLGLVVGVPHDPRGRIEAPIGRDPHARTRFAVVAGGKPAVTRYRVLDTAQLPTAAGRGEVALLACALESGRTHQIRVHLAALGHPVVGDVVYGRTRGPAEALGLGRPFLHAASLRFRHPVTGARVHLEESLPDELAAALAGAAMAVPDAAVVREMG